MNSKENIINGLKIFKEYPARSFQMIRTVIDLIYRNHLFNINRFNNIPLPRFLSIKLTNNCNLRCKMCMLWGSNGAHLKYNENIKEMEFNWDLLKKTLLSLKRIKPTVILWGGETLLYSKFSELLYLLNDLKFPFDISTNGTHLIDYTDTFERIRGKFGILVSLDGFEDIHDNIRGKGIFQKTIQGIKSIIDINKKRKKMDKILIGIELTVLEDNFHILYEFVKYLNEFELSWIVLNMQWIMDQNTGEQYQDHLIKNWFNKNLSNNAIPQHWEWVGYVDSVDNQKLPIVEQQIQMIQKSKWKVPVLFQPPIKPHEIFDYYNKISKPVASKKNCRAHWSKMVIYPDGSVYACKHNPDIKLGNINDNSINEIWNNNYFINFRKFVKQSIFPICSKCHLLYTFGK